MAESGHRPWDVVGALRQQLARAVAEAAAEDLPTLVGTLVEAEERARVRLRGPAVVGTTPPGRAPEPEWLTLRQAGAMAGVRQSKTVIRWLRGRSWIKRVGRQWLVEKGPFVRWLQTR